MTRYLLLIVLPLLLFSPGNQGNLPPATCAVRVVDPQAEGDGKAGPRTYEPPLTPLSGAVPLLAAPPEFVEPIRAARRFEAPVLVDDAGADLHVRAWRFSYNARGIIEVPNRL